MSLNVIQNIILLFVKWKSSEILERWHALASRTGTCNRSGNRIFNIMRFIEDVQKALLQGKGKSGGDEDID